MSSYLPLVNRVKACEFACGEKEVLFTHVRTTHLNQSTIPSKNCLLWNNISSLTPALPQMSRNNFSMVPVAFFLTWQYKTNIVEQSAITIITYYYYCLSSENKLRGMAKGTILVTFSPLSFILAGWGGKGGIGWLSGGEGRRGAGVKRDDRARMPEV